MVINILFSFQGMKVTSTFLVLLVSTALASVCPPGEKYWNSSLESCVNCTRCDPALHVVLRPCEVHRDTVCGPLSNLDIDWSWLHKHHKRHHGKHHGHREDRERFGGHSEVSCRDDVNQESKDLQGLHVTYRGDTYLESCSAIDRLSRVQFLVFEFIMEIW